MKSWIAIASKFGFPAISFDMAGITRLPHFVEETKVCATALCSKQRVRAHGFL